VLLISLALVAASLDSKSATARFERHVPAANLSNQIDDGGDTTSTTVSFTNAAPITIVDKPAGSTTSGAANPFPSDITVSGIIGAVSKVTVKLYGYNHGWPDDVDVLLVSPTNQKLMLMSDAGASADAVNATLEFDDAAQSTLPDAGPIVSGTFKPSDYPEESISTGTDTFAAPAPSPPYGSTLAVFNNADPNGTWKLYIGDDETGLNGSMNLGWSLTITNTIAGQNTAGINFPDSGPASLYPSNISIAGLPGVVTDVQVILEDFSHVAPDDVDLLLVSPGGRSVVVMSDVGGSGAVTNVDLILDDNVVGSLPDNGPLVSGTFKPTNIGTGDSFPSPAPASPPSGETLAALDGINPNGTWSLYAVDDASGNTGSITGGWSLAILTSTLACGVNLSPSIQTFPITGGSGSVNVFPVSPGCDWTASTVSDFITLNSNSGTGDGVVSFTVAPNMGGGRTGRISVTTANFTQNFTVQQPSGCPFALNQEAQNFDGAGGPGTVAVTASGICGWTSQTAQSWITINSGTGTGNGNVTFTVAANSTAQQRVGEITIGARTLTITQAPATGNTVLDFDGDGKTDYVVARTAGGNHVWYLLQSQAGMSGMSWGQSSTIPVPEDYDGDGKWDLAVWQQTGAPHAFYILRSQTNTFQAVEWGATSDDPRITQDFDGDGKADPAVTRYEGSNLSWYILSSSSGQVTSAVFGALTDVPIRGDFDGDGKADLAVYRRANGSPANTFYVLHSSTGGVHALTFGNSASDYIVPADFDGDGKTDYAVWRGRTSGNPGAGAWYWVQSSDGALRGAQFGLAATDLPAPGDFDGDGRTDIAVWRPGSSAVFYVDRSTAGFTAVPWGNTGDLVPGFSLQAR
jgi:subtilisin-like proprotein convertase family protein